ncbi:uncharacterized protein LOC143021346 [Oratosquilla oratoria]|uniref:uncharacterized protein LOC143021346 n=1 Tax=Oratosquilla oratoria TaxID=337810 RepID=UPI003F766A5E
MAITQLLLLSTMAAVGLSAPQLPDDNPPPIPHRFEYGVNADDDAKEHKQVTTGDGRTEGEYKVLQANGLYRVVRYSVFGDSGFKAIVSEEPGPPIANYYNNDLTGESRTGLASSASPAPASSGPPAPAITLNAASSGAGKSVVSSRPSINTVTSQQPFRQVQLQQRPQPVFAVRQPVFQQNIVSSFDDSDEIDDISFIPGRITVSSPSGGALLSGGIIDGGIIDGGFIGGSGQIIDGGIIDGGIIDGGIIDGGIIDGGFINDYGAV